MQPEKYQTCGMDPRVARRASWSGHDQHGLRHRTDQEETFMAANGQAEAHKALVRQFVEEFWNSGHLTRRTN